MFTFLNSPRLAPAPAAGTVRAKKLFEMGPKFRGQFFCRKRHLNLIQLEQRKSLQKEIASQKSISFLESAR
jgi:hypothetical protein